MNLLMDALAIQTWGLKVDAVIISIPFTVELTELIVLTLLVATVMILAMLMVTAVMTSLKLDALVRHTVRTLCIHAYRSVCASVADATCTGSVLPRIACN